MEYRDSINPLRYRHFKKGQKVRIIHEPDLGNSASLDGGSVGSIITIDSLKRDYGRRTDAMKDYWDDPDYVNRESYFHTLEIGYRNCLTLELVHDED